MSAAAAQSYIDQAIKEGRLTLRDLQALVMVFQDDYNLGVDGMPGPLTVAKLRTLQYYKAAGPDQPSLPTQPVRAAGARALAEAQRMWSLAVIDPQRSDGSPLADKSRRVINDILKANGWGGEPYMGDGQVEWCGLFAGACWRAAGLDPKWLTSYFPSTYRLDLWANYRDFPGAIPNPKPADPTAWRLIANLDQYSKGLPWDPQPGDILMIGDGLPAAGDHICLVESFDKATGIFKTYEGNGNGLLPDGTRRHGIVRGERHLGGQGYYARRLIRPGTADLL